MLIVFIWCLVCYGSAEGANTTTATSNITTTATPSITTTTTPSITTTATPRITTTATPSITTIPQPATLTSSWDTSTSNHLFCYQCSASSADEPCVTDTDRMANMSTRDFYIKDCTASNPKWNICMIQTVEAGGKLLFFHRDCQDSTYFLAPFNSPRFANISANNMSTCDLIQDKVFCYRPCMGNLCNGPKTYVNKTDCSQYVDNPDGNGTFPPGVECGTLGLHSRIDQGTLLIMLLITAVLCVNANTLQPYL